ncbi:hypothetical protein GXP67_28050 [Rhodocytophaga rosea]|uniref:Uncharacterized protein n=1 Tax=Rhodocytophaga rosea TaxID=2704465 RepID=A0A6C0GQ79_9BACT|nr:hypothetical protein [Rhodocytophaga rosea]QHT70226.1 hypothetical protein GXP67_28050 [Rhodocytophaga rosea]
MKTIHQHIDSDLQTLTGSTAPWGETETDTNYSPEVQTIYQTVAKKCHQVKTWIGQTILASLEGQVKIVDEMVREGSRLYPYNFTGSSQALFLFPTSYRRHILQQDTLLPATNVEVERLDENRYEVKFNRKTDDAILSIYDQSGELLFTEQIHQTGTFNLIYNLQWTGLSQVSFEVLSKKRSYRSEII